MKQELMPQYRQVIFTPYKIRNKIINEDRLGRDIDNFRPKEQLKVLQSYMSKEDIKQRIIHKKEMMRRQALAFLNSHKSNTLNCGFFMGNKQNLFGGFNKTGLKAYYKFDSFYLPTATFTENYTSTSGWTQVGTLVDIDATVADACAFNNTPANADHREHKSLGVTLSDTVWTARFKFNITSQGSGNNCFCFWLSAGTGKPRDGSTDGLGFFISDSGAGNIPSMVKSNGGALGSGGAQAALAEGATKDIELQRVSATLMKLTIFDNNTFTPTNTPTTFTIDSTITGLTTLQHASDDGGGSAATIVANITNTTVYNSVNPVLKNYATDVGSGDSLGTAADGTLNGALSVVSGKIDNAYDYDGATAYCQAGTSLSQFNFLHNPTTWTVNFWFKPDTIAGGQEGTIFATETGGSTNNVGIECYYSSNLIVLGILRGGAGTYVITNASVGITLPDTNWHMISLRYDQSLGSNNLDAWLDGSHSGYLSKTANAPSSSDAQSALVIGKTTGWANWLEGLLDEMSIWNRYLTDAELTALYNSGNGAVIT